MGFSVIHVTVLGGWLSLGNCWYVLILIFVAINLKCRTLGDQWTVNQRSLEEEGVTGSLISSL